jgi:DeoR/GlpR family transcriptional regulator of sugar metabolism
MLSSIAADVVVMGVRGITKAGISDTNTLVVESIRSMIKAARKVVIVADHSKFGRDAMVHVADLADIDMVISDGGVAPEYRDMLKENDVDLVLASEMAASGSNSSDVHASTLAASSERGAGSSRLILK